MAAFRDLKDLVDEVKRTDLLPMLATRQHPGNGLDNIRTAQMLVELPADWNDWPEDAKLACPEENWDASKGLDCDLQGHGPLFATCKYVDRETGACMIYDRRPAMCRNYGAMPEKYNPKGTCQWTHCASNVDGQCRPNL